MLVSNSVGSTHPLPGGGRKSASLLVTRKRRVEGVARLVCLHKRNVRFAHSLSRLVGLRSTPRRHVKLLRVTEYLGEKGVIKTTTKC